MKVEHRENEVEFIPESDYDRECIARILTTAVERVTYGKSASRSWPPPARESNLLIVLRDPRQW